MTTRSNQAPPVQSEDDRGFVIVGVVMFVLALTILGLSLFSLSSYESQFLSRSLAREQAFNAAWSGIERARYRLSANAVMDSVKGIKDTEGVNYAVAYQMQGGLPDSIGPVDPSRNVSIRVEAVTEGQQVILEGQFHPTGSLDFYRRLISTPGGIVDAVVAEGVPRIHTVELDGTVLANGVFANFSNLQAPGACNLIASPTVPMPDIAGFIAAKLPSALTMTASCPAAVYHLDQVTGNPVNFYKWVPGGECAGGATQGFSLEEFTGSPTFHVHGIAVLLLPNGLRIFSRLNVDGNAGDALVIVCGEATDITDGVQLNQALVTDIPVILVSNSRAFIHTPAGADPLQVDYLSIYAGSVYLAGPQAPNVMTLRHSANAPEDGPNGLIHTLTENDALPNPPSLGTSLSLVPGSWRQSSN